VEVEDILDEVYHRGSHYDEQDEQGYHRENTIQQGVQQITERDLQHSYPFCSLEPVLLVEGKVLVCAEDIDTDGEAAQAPRD
jgi:hypothetical protein